MAAMLSCGVAACVGFAEPPSAILAGTVKDEKALYTAEAAYYGSAQLIKLSLDSGLVKPGTPTAIKIADYDQAAYTALVSARNAYQLGNATGYKTSVESVLNLTGNVQALLRPLNSKQQ
jgi:hypothetical protein